MSDHAPCYQAVGVLVWHAHSVLNHLVHQWLSEGRIVYLIVAPKSKSTDYSIQPFIMQKYRIYSIKRRVIYYKLFTVPYFPVRS